MTKERLISGYKRYLETTDEQRLDVPNGYENQFWEWFIRKSYLFNKNKIRKKLQITNITIRENNFCFKNTFRISKGFIKKLAYFEGLAYSGNAVPEYLKHAFNVSKSGKVSDYSLEFRADNQYDYYVGVKIPLSFAREVYLELGDYEYSQYSLLN